MVRVGKWGEEKITFTYDFNVDESAFKHGSTTFGDASGDITINTGLESVKRAWLEVQGATAGWVSATSGATITAHPNATAGAFLWFAFGYPPS